MVFYIQSNLQYVLHSPKQFMFFVCVRYSPADIAFLGKYANTMGPVAKAINILQGQSNIQMGWLLPTINTLISNLDKKQSIV